MFLRRRRLIAATGLAAASSALEICEREDPAYTVLHQNATFTAKRKAIGWKDSPSFAMEFRAVNFATN